MLSSATSLSTKQPPVLPGGSTVVSHSFPFDQGCDAALLVPSGVARFFLMPFSKVFMYYGAQWMFAPHVCVDSLGVVSRLRSLQSIAAIDRGSLGFSSLGRLQGLHQHLFTLKIIFNWDYRVVVCHHSSLPGGGSGKHSSLKWWDKFSSPKHNRFLSVLHYCQAQAT